jgi:tetratricopeptide (TPR) repeat protein
MVLGPGPERTCFEAAEAGKASSDGIAECTIALSESSLSPRDRAATYSNRSVLLLAREKATLALKDTNAALAIMPSMTAAAVNKSAALILLGKYQDAIATVDAAVPLANGVELKRALFNRAMAYEATGDLKSAYRDLKRAVDLDPQFEAATTELARFQVDHK